MEFQADVFAQQNERFLHWLQNSLGFTLNPKIAISDLRTTGAGRGLGRFIPSSTDRRWGGGRRVRQLTSGGGWG